MKVHKIESQSQIPDHITLDDIIAFLHTHLDKFTDSPSAIAKAIDYAFSPQPGKGGYIILGTENDRLIGCVVMNRSGMDEYIPDDFLVYIAVHKDFRGKGLGAKLMKAVQEHSSGAIALHVEYDNPAMHLYKRMGFTSKYAEMRWAREK